MGEILQAESLFVLFLGLSYRKNAEFCLEAKANEDSKMVRYLADVGERIADGALFRLALMVVEIGLKLLPGFDGVGYKFPLGPKSQFADITIRGAGSAPDESDNNELSVRHCDIMAGRQGGSQMSATILLADRKR